MLVLSRGKHQSVIIGGEIRLRVEEIRERDGQGHVFGGSVRLGFDIPRDIPVYREELCKRRPRGDNGSAAPPRPPAPEGELVEIQGALVRLRIELPPKIPISLNGERLGQAIAAPGDGSSSTALRSAHLLTCHQEDRIVICGNIVIATLEFHRFVFAGRAEPRCFARRP